MNEQRYRIIFAATLSFFFNLLYAIYNGILGARDHSLRLAAMCASYIILGAMRFFAILFQRKNNKTISVKTEFFVMKFFGIMLTILSIVFNGHKLYQLVTKCRCEISCNHHDNDCSLYIWKNHNSNYPGCQTA